MVELIIILIIAWIIGGHLTYYSAAKKLKTMANNETVEQVLRKLRYIPMQNTPKHWRKHRKIFDMINQSSEVDPELKQVAKDLYIKKGLNIHNVKINTYVSRARG